MEAEDPVNLQNLQSDTINGFVPVIINIAPIMNVPLLIGKVEKPKTPPLSQF